MAYPLKKNGEVVGYRSRGSKAKRREKGENVVIKRNYAKTEKPPKPKTKALPKVKPENVNIGSNVPDMTRYGYERYGVDGYYTTFGSKSSPQSKPHETIVWHHPHNQFNTGDISCSCRGWIFKRTCRHIKSVESDIQRAKR